MENDNDILSIYMHACTAFLKCTEQAQIAVLGSRLANGLRPYGHKEASTHAAGAVKAHERAQGFMLEVVRDVERAKDLSEYEGLGLTDRGLFLALRSQMENTLESRAKHYRNIAHDAAESVADLATDHERESIVLTRSSVLGWREKIEDAMTTLGPSVADGEDNDPGMLALSDVVKDIREATES